MSLFVLNESSLASTKNLHKFFARLDPIADKVLLVGDVRQHQAVEAGRPFGQFQEHGMTTAQLTEIVRQRNLKLRKTVNDLSRRKIPEAVDQLARRGKVIEIANEQERFEAIAKNYCQNPVGTLVVSRANRERVELNLRIHKQLQREGKMSRDDHQIKVYVNRDMTGPERTFANAYRQPSTDHRLTQPPTHNAPAPTKAAELETEGPELDLGGMIFTKDSFYPTRF